MDEFISAPVPSRSKSNWLGQNAGRYRGQLRHQARDLANRGYSWRDIMDITKAGFQGGLGKESPAGKFVGGLVDSIKDIKKLPQAVRKLRMGNQQYSTPPPFPAQGQFKSASMQKEALTSKGALKKGIKQLLNLLRTKGARQDFLTGRGDKMGKGLMDLATTSSLPERIGKVLGEKRYSLQRRGASSAILSELRNAVHILSGITKAPFTDRLSQKGIDQAASEIWHRIRNQYVPSASKIKTPLDKWY